MVDSVKVFHSAINYVDINYFTFKLKVMTVEKLREIYTRIEKPKWKDYGHDQEYIRILEAYNAQTENEVAQANAKIGYLKGDVRMWKFVCGIAVVTTLGLIIIKLIN